MLEPCELQKVTAIIVNPELDFSGEVDGQIKHSFPDVSALLEEKPEEGAIEYVQTRTETVVSRGAGRRCTRTLYVLPYKLNNEGINDYSKLHEILCKLDCATTTHKTESFKLAVVGNMVLNYLRKCNPCSRVPVRRWKLLARKPTAELSPKQRAPKLRKSSYVPKANNMPTFSGP